MTDKETPAPELEPSVRVAELTKQISAFTKDTSRSVIQGTLAEVSQELAKWYLKLGDDPSLADNAVDTIVKSLKELDKEDGFYSSTNPKRLNISRYFLTRLDAESKLILPGDFAGWMMDMSQLEEKIQTLVDELDWDELVGDARAFKRKVDIQASNRARERERIVDEKERSKEPSLLNNMPTESAEVVVDHAVTNDYYGTDIGERVFGAMDNYINSVLKPLAEKYPAFNSVIKCFGITGGLFSWGWWDQNLTLILRHGKCNFKGFVEKQPNETTRLGSARGLAGHDSFRNLPEYRLIILPIVQLAYELHLDPRHKIDNTPVPWTSRTLDFEGLLREAFQILNKPENATKLDGKTGKLKYPAASILQKFMSGFPEATDPNNPENNTKPRMERFFWTMAWYEFCTLDCGREIDFYRAEAFGDNPNGNPGGQPEDGVAKEAWNLYRFGTKGGALSQEGISLALLRPPKWVMEGKLNSSKVCSWVEPGSERDLDLYGIKKADNPALDSQREELIKRVELARKLVNAILYYYFNIPMNGFLPDFDTPAFDFVDWPSLTFGPWLREFLNAYERDVVSSGGDKYIKGINGIAKMLEMIETCFLKEPIVKAGERPDEVANRLMVEIRSWGSLISDVTDYYWSYIYQKHVVGGKKPDSELAKAKYEEMKLFVKTLTKFYLMYIMSSIPFNYLQPSAVLPEVLRKFRPEALLSPSTRYYKGIYEIMKESIDEHRKSNPSLGKFPKSPAEIAESKADHGESDDLALTILQELYKEMSEDPKYERRSFGVLNNGPRTWAEEFWMYVYEARGLKEPEEEQKTHEPTLRGIFYKNAEEKKV